jgi:hypothetical protein
LGWSASSKVATDRQGLRQLAFGGQRAPVDDVALLRKPPQPIGEAPDEWSDLLVPPADETGNLTWIQAHEEPKVT